VDQKNSSGGWFMDMLAIAAFFVGVYVLVGYGMDLSAGAERNPILDRIVVVWAIGSLLFLTIWYIRNFKDL